MVIWTCHTKTFYWNYEAKNVFICRIEIVNLIWYISDVTFLTSMPPLDEHDFKLARTIENLEKAVDRSHVVNFTKYPSLKQHDAMLDFCWKTPMELDYLAKHFELWIHARENLRAVSSKEQGEDRFIAWNASAWKRVHKNCLTFIVQFNMDALL